MVALCSLGLMMAACGDNSTGTNGDGNGNGNGGGTEIGTDPIFANVQEIFEQSCGGSSCHIGGRQSGVRLDGYDNVTQSKGSQYGKLVIQKGDAVGSPLIDKIEANPANGARMPRGGSPLSEERINQIKKWIDNGAENN